MINIIKQLFSDNNIFQIRETSSFNDETINCFFAIPNNQMRKEYYLVAQMNDIEGLITPGSEKDFSKVYSRIVKEDYYDSSFNKNINLILLFKSDTPLVNDKTKRLVYEIEENPYYFKKHVLIYTEKQLTDLATKCENITILNLEELITEMDFKEFKTNPYSNDYKQLLLNIYTKISFLKTPNKRKDIENLNSKIAVKLINNEINGLEDLRQSLLKDEGKSIYELFTIPKTNN